MLAILGLLGVGALCALDSASKKSQMDSKYKKLDKQGAFMKSNYDRFYMIHQDYWDEWHTGNRESFPKEYIVYFERNYEAAKEYIFALTAAKEIEEGYAPVLHPGSYNKFTFDPMARFNSLYREKIKIFNETGKCYF